MAQSALDVFSRLHILRMCMAATVGERAGQKEAGGRRCPCIRMRKGPARPQQPSLRPDARRPKQQGQAAMRLPAQLAHCDSLFTSRSKEPHVPRSLPSHNLPFPPCCCVLLHLQCSRADLACCVCLLSVPPRPLRAATRAPHASQPYSQAIALPIDKQHTPLGRASYTAHLTFHLQRSRSAPQLPFRAPS